MVPSIVFSLYTVDKQFHSRNYGERIPCVSIVLFRFHYIPGTLHNQYHSYPHFPPIRPRSRAPRPEPPDGTGDNCHYYQIAADHGCISNFIFKPLLALCVRKIIHSVAIQTLAHIPSPRDDLFKRGGPRRTIRAHSRFEVSKSVLICLVSSCHVNNSMLVLV